GPTSEPKTRLSIADPRRAAPTHPIARRGPASQRGFRSGQLSQVLLLCEFAPHQPLGLGVATSSLWGNSTLSYISRRATLQPMEVRCSLPSGSLISLSIHWSPLSLYRTKCSTRTLSCATSTYSTSDSSLR